MKPEVKVGDIVFSQCHKGHFYIILGDLKTTWTEQRKFKLYSSSDGSLFYLCHDQIPPSDLKYLSKGCWEIIGT